LYSNPHLIETLAGYLNSLFQDTLNGKLVCLKQTVRAEVEILPVVFNLFVFAISIFKESWSEFVSVYHSRFIQLLTGKNRFMKSYAILGMAALGSAVNSTELLQLAISNSVQALHVSQIFMKTNVFNALNILIRVNYEGLVVHADVIRSAIFPVFTTLKDQYLLYESAAALWCNCTIVFGWQIDINEATLVLSNVQIQCGEDLGRSVDFAKFIATINLGPSFMGIAKRIAVRGFTRPAYFFGLIGDGNLRTLRALILDSLDVEQELMQMLGFDQRTTRLVVTRLSQILS
jgi:hypothetical protein